MMKKTKDKKRARQGLTLQSVIGRRLLAGILHINKPAGITSYGVVVHVRRLLMTYYRSAGQADLLPTIKVGHSGTLDPFATGVLLVAIGRATRLIEYTHEWDKEYEVTLTLGATSDTDDLEGNITKNQVRQQITKAQIINLLKRLRGEIKQRPPVYSAKKIGGKRSYQLARRGVLPQLALQTVTIYGTKILAYRYPQLQLRVSCSTGTYVRALVRDIGQALGVGAYAIKLTRTRIGPYNIRNAVDLSRLTNKEELTRNLWPEETLVQALPAIVLTGDNVAQFVRGQTVGGKDKFKGETKNIAVYSKEGLLIGTALFDRATGLLKPRKVLV